MPSNRFHELLQQRRAKSAHERGLLELGLAIAAQSSQVRVDAAKVPFRFSPPNLLDLRLDDPAIGIDSPRAVSTLKANLSRALPAAAPAIAQIPESPALNVGDLARYIALSTPGRTAEKVRKAATDAVHPWPTFTIMKRSAQTQMRNQVKKVCGSAFASKATDELVHAIAAPARPRIRLAAREALLPAAASLLPTAAESITAAPRAIVLEFAAPPVPATAPAAESIARAARESIAPDAIRLVEFGARQMRIAEQRDRFQKQVAAVCADLERAARQTLGGLRESLAASAAAASVVELCWLNNTVRSRVPPRMLGEVAADRKLDRIDLPRRLARELSLSAVTVGAPVFRGRFSQTGAGVVVAVIDSEVAANHPAFGGRVIPVRDFTVEGFGRPDPHGTAVAGIIGSADRGFTGIAPGVTIRNYKVLATDTANDADDFGGALAIQAALEDGAQVANCSWGAGPIADRKSREARACDTAWEGGMIVVKSVGNAGPGARTATTPAEADGIIVVGATDRSGSQVQDYSSRGPAAGKPRPHLLAPGGAIGDGVTSCRVGGGFIADAGTSFAAPHVTGLVALLLEHNPAATPDEIRTVLIDHCRKFASNRANTHGAGLVSLDALQ